MGGRPLATLHDLQTIYTMADLYDLLEILEVHMAVLEEQNKEEERKAQANRQR